MSSQPLAQLPAELWYLIAENLNHIQIQSFLGVSRLHRLVASKLLFSHFNIYLGLPFQYKIFYPPQEVDSVLQNKMELAYDMLSAIRKIPSFARVIKKLSIRVHLNHSEFDVFHIGIICEALMALPHLVCFNWIGNFLPVEIFQSLVTHCPNVKELFIDSLAFPLSNIESNLLHLIHLRRLALPKFILPHDGRSMSGLKDNITFLCTPLTWRFSLPTFENLAELEITLIDDFEDLLPVSRHTMRLECLAFVNIRRSHVLPRILEENPAAWPLLTSFKLLGDSSVFDADHILQLSEFLKTKMYLRRLDLHFYCLCITPILDALHKFPLLEVLGLFTGTEIIFAEHYLKLAAALPPNLIALRLFANWQLIPENIETVEVLMQRLQNLRNLSLFYVGHDDAPVTFLIEDLASELKHLSIVGVDHELSYVDRTTRYFGDLDSDTTVELTPWSSQRVLDRTLEDFGGCEDYEWLLRHHDLEGCLWD